MASPAKKLAEARVGTRLDGKWTLDSFLGYGGSAAVYAATHRNGKRAAIKVLHAHCAADPDLVARFVREGYLANKIQHPGVVAALDDDTAEDGSVYLVMDLLDGGSFERHGRGLVQPLTIVEGLQIADDLLDILVAAHAIGLVHRDIKPANIFLTSSGQLKILDFGIARLVENFGDGVTQTGMLMGTPAYMPPEQARGRWSEVDARSDLWAVGVTLASLMTGKRPRPAAETSAEELLAAMMQPIPSLATLLPEAPPEVIALIDRAYAFERDDRWQTAAEMQAAVRAIRGTIHGERPFPASLTMRLSSDSRSSPPAPQGDSTGPSPFYGSTLLTPPVARRSVHEVEPVPSLTTNRAMMSSAAPEPPASSRGSGTALVGIVVGLLVAVGIIALGVTVGRARWAAATATSTPAAPSASVALPLLQASATGAPAAPAVSAVGAASSVMPASDAAVVSSSAAPADRKRDKRPKPKPAGDGTTDPNSFFDKRF